MGYGESQAYRAGMYETAEGYSFYPPNDDEEENDMAVKKVYRIWPRWAGAYANDERLEFFIIYTDDSTDGPFNTLADAERFVGAQCNSK